MQHVSEPLGKEPQCLKGHNDCHGGRGVGVEDMWKSSNESTAIVMVAVAWVGVEDMWKPSNESTAIVMVAVAWVGVEDM